MRRGEGVNGKKTASYTLSPGKNVETEQVGPRRSEAVRSYYRRPTKRKKDVSVRKRKQDTDVNFEQSGTLSACRLQIEGMWSVVLPWRDGTTKQNSVYESGLLLPQCEPHSTYGVA